MQTQKANWKIIVGIFLNLLIGLNFLLSAYAKIPAIEVFGWTIAESTPFNWTIAEWIARLVIGLEFFLGFLFISQLFIKQMAIPASALLLVLFSVYLIYVLFAYGNEANCGCYGELIPLSTKESLIKNGIILLIIALAYKFLFQVKFRFYRWLVLVMLAISFIYPFYEQPPASIVIFPNKDIKNKEFPIHLIENKDNYLSDRKKIIALVSPSCKYCKKAARRMSIIKKRNPQIPFQFVMAGHRNHLQDFITETRSDNIPLIFMDSIPNFQKLNGRTAVPTIKWIEDSTVVKTSTYFSLNENEILEWLIQ